MQNEHPNPPADYLDEWRDQINKLRSDMVLGDAPSPTSTKANLLVVSAWALLEQAAVQMGLALLAETEETK